MRSVIPRTNLLTKHTFQNKHRDNNRNTREMLHEKPEDLIQSSIESFEIDPDLLTLDRIDDNILKILQHRQSVIQTHQDQNHQLSTRINDLNREITKVLDPLNHQLPQNPLGESSDSTETTSGDILKLISQRKYDLDNHKLTIAKQLNDLESMINNQHVQKIHQDNKLSELMTQYDEIINKNLIDYKNSNTMKINLFKLLGMVVDRNEEKNQDLILVYNEKYGISNILDIDENLNDYFISNFIWDKL